MPSAQSLQPLPDEVCERCGKTISRRAIANVHGDQVLCSGCYGKAQDAVRVAASWKTPPTERQTKYATALGLSFHPSATFLDLRDLLNCHFSGDKPSPGWLIEYAQEIEALVSVYT